MAKWYNAKAEDALISYNMEYFRAISVELTGRDLWTLCGDYGNPELLKSAEKTQVRIVNSDEEAICALYDAVVKWLQSADQDVFDQEAFFEDFAVKNE